MSHRFYRPVLSWCSLIQSLINADTVMSLSSAICFSALRSSFVIVSVRLTIFLSTFSFIVILLAHRYLCNCVTVYHEKPSISIISVNKRGTFLFPFSLPSVLRLHHPAHMSLSYLCKISSGRSTLAASFASSWLSSNYLRAPSFWVINNLPHHLTTVLLPDCHPA